MSVGELADVLALNVTGSGMGGDVSSAVGVIVEKLSDGAGGVGDNVGGAEMVGVDVAGDWGPGLCPGLHRLIDRREKCIAVVDVGGRGGVCDCAALCGSEGVVFARVARCASGRALHHARAGVVVGVIGDRAALRGAKQSVEVVPSIYPIPGRCCVSV